MKKMSNRKDMINILKRCISKSTYQFKRFDKFYDRMMKHIADSVDVNSDDYKMEQRHLALTTYSNISTWFNTLKKFFIKKGFVRERTDEDVDVEGELVYFNLQLEF